MQLGVRTRLSLDFLGQLFMVLYIFLWPVRLNLSNLILISDLFPLHKLKLISKLPMKMHDITTSKRDNDLRGVLWVVQR